MSILERIETLRGGDPYRAYLHVREEVLRMLSDQREATVRPSAYWREELSGFEYMLDASPLVIEKLRHHTYHVTGLRVYDYRSGQDKRRAALARKLDALRAVGDESLLVPESPQLGGFGFEIDGGLYNIDTLKFFEVLLALDRAEELDRFRRGGDALVVEVGSGWGGFAFQLRTLFPHVRYVLVDLPELFLFSAVYLLTLFPDARAAFMPGPEDPAWNEADFIFVPNTHLDHVPLRSIDLALNMVSFQEMTTEQVREYARWLYDHGAQTVYSLNRDRSRYNDELSSVRELLGERFWLEEPFVLPHQYLEQPKSKEQPRLPRPGLDDPAADGANRYRHVIGRPRLSPAGL